LGDRDATADFSCCITRVHGGDVILAGRSAVHTLPEAWREHPVWDRVRRFCDAWVDPTSSLHSAVREIWLEFDVDGASTPEIPVPNVFLGPVVGRSAAACNWFVECAIPLLLGAPLSPSVEHTLRGCLNALPPAAWVRHVGVMLARQTDALRLEIKNFPFASLPRFLETVGYPVGSNEPHAALAPAVSLAPARRMMLSLDAGATIGSTVGVECFAPVGAERSLTWTAFVDYLVASGLCATAKRATLDARGEWIHEPDVNGAAPDRLAPASRVVGLPVRGVFVAALSHVKLKHQPDRPLQAKAYLAVDLRWRLL
jgi:hypothetical protein